MKLRMIFVLFLITGLLVPAVAQETGDPARSRRAKRFLALGGVSFLDSKEPVSFTGALLQVSFKQSRIVRTIDPNSDQGSLPGHMESKLKSGNIDIDLAWYLQSMYDLGISTNATLRDSSDVWLLLDGSNHYTIKRVGENFGVFAKIHEEILEFPRYYLHLLAGGVLSVGEDPCLAQLGAIRRNDSATFTSAGLLLQWSTIDEALAPLARVEIQDVIGIQAGPTYSFDHEDWGWYLGCDFMKGLWGDLGLK